MQRTLNSVVLKEERFVPVPTAALVLVRAGIGINCVCSPCVTDRDASRCRDFAPADADSDALRSLSLSRWAPVEAVSTLRGLSPRIDPTS